MVNMLHVLVGTPVVLFLNVDDPFPASNIRPQKNMPADHQGRLIANPKHEVDRSRGEKHRLAWSEDHISPFRIQVLVRLSHPGAKLLVRGMRHPAETDQSPVDG